MLLGLLVGAIVFFALCYKIYGGFMSRVYELNDSNKTPAETMYSACFNDAVNALERSGWRRL